MGSRQALSLVILLSLPGVVRAIKDPERLLAEVRKSVF